MLRQGVVTENKLTLATVVTARSSKRTGKPFGVLIVENALYSGDDEREQYSYYTLKTGLLGRAIWGYLRYEKPDDYILSNGQVAHVYNGVHRGFFGNSPTYGLTVE